MNYLDSLVDAVFSLDRWEESLPGTSQDGLVANCVQRASALRALYPDGTGVVIAAPEVLAEFSSVDRLCLFSDYLPYEEVAPQLYGRNIQFAFASTLACDKWSGVLKNRMRTPGSILIEIA